MGTFSAVGQSHRPSRLVEIMRSYARSHGGAGFGFRQPPTVARRVAALVAAFSQIDQDSIAAAVQAGADGVEIRWANGSDARKLSLLAGRLSVPWGVCLPLDADASTAAIAQEAGADWVRLPLGGVISSMQWEKPARVLTVPFELDLHLAQGVNGLAVDAVLVEPAAGALSEYTYVDAVRVRALSEIMKKPLMMHAGPGLPPGAAAACEHLGVDGLLVDVDGSGSIDTLGAYLHSLTIRAEHR